MITEDWRDTRRLVPRWRSLEATFAAGELSAPGLRREPYVYRPAGRELVDKLAQWRSKGDLLTAAELVEAAIVDGKEFEAIPAARLLVGHPTAARAVRVQAARLLTRTTPEEELPAALLPVAENSAAIWRARTRRYPESSLAWVELSLHQTVQGHLNHAMRSMRVALQLAPNNRHVLRSAARLFLHKEDAERAHDLIARNSATRGDPWLMAAEIALADLAERRPRFTKRGIVMLDDGGLMPRQVTELAGAIATVELLEGNRKRAKRHFEQSLGDPTGNSIAQAEWASPRIGFDLVPPRRLRGGLELHEAWTFHLSREQKLIEAIAEAVAWSEEERTSLRPLRAAASIASSIDEYELAEMYAGRGLALQSDHKPLVNIRAFALGSLGRLDEAEKVLRQLKGADETQNLVALANRGLIALRRGLHSEGLELYERAITGFHLLRDNYLQATAQVYLAREASLAKVSGASEFLNQARKSAEKFKKEPIYLQIAKIEAILGGQENADSARVNAKAR